MFRNILRPRAHLSGEVTFDLSYRLREERACTSCRVKHLYAVHLHFFLTMLEILFYLALNIDLAGVSKSHRQIELLLKQFVHSANDEVNHRLRCVIDTALFLGGRVVLEQEIFIEMQDRVSLSCALAEALHDFLHVRSSKGAHEVVNNPGDTFVEVVAGNLLEDLAEERIGFWDEISRFGTCEIIGCGVVQSCGKHTVGDGLRVDVSELLGRYIMDKHLAEILHITTQLGGIIAVLNQGLLDDVAEHARLASHELRELACRGDTLRCGSLQVLHQSDETIGIR